MGQRYFKRKSLNDWNGVTNALNPNVSCCVELIESRTGKQTGGQDSECKKLSWA